MKFRRLITAFLVLFVAFSVTAFSQDKEKNKKVKETRTVKTVNEDQWISFNIDGVVVDMIAKLKSESGKQYEVSMVIENTTSEAITVDPSSNLTAVAADNLKKLDNPTGVEYRAISAYDSYAKKFDNADGTGTPAASIAASSDKAINQVGYLRKITVNPGETVSAFVSVKRENDALFQMSFKYNDASAAYIWKLGNDILFPYEEEVVEAKQGEKVIPTKMSKFSNYSYIWYSYLNELSIQSAKSSKSSTTIVMYDPNEFLLSEPAMMIIGAAGELNVLSITKGSGDHTILELDCKSLAFPFSIMFPENDEYSLRNITKQK